MNLGVFKITESKNEYYDTTNISFILNVHRHSSLRELIDETEKDELDRMTIGINGVGGLVGSHVLSVLTDTTEAAIKASYFPIIPSSLATENITISKTNILLPEDNRVVLENVDAFLHMAGKPIHYADLSLVPEIFAVNAIGSPLVALSAHDQNKKHQATGKGALRMVIISSISSVWMDSYISMLSSEGSEKREVGEKLRKWLAEATDEFIKYTERYHKEPYGEKPIEFVRQYLHQKNGLIEIVGGIEKFDHYALSKLLMDKVLMALAEKEVIENVIVIRPGSLLGTGLQNKDDPGFIPKMVIQSYNKKAVEIWDERIGYYLPISTFVEILKDLILIPEDRITNRIEFINIPGKDILQKDFYIDYILPVLIKNTGLKKSELMTRLKIIPNPNPTDKARYVSTKTTHNFIKGRYAVTPDLLRKVTQEITERIISELRQQELNDMSIGWSVEPISTRRANDTGL
jgi:nucleoside-diphosphate-sugar epimerase